MRSATRTHLPGPDLSPLAGLRAFRRDPIGLLELSARFGDVAYLRLPGTDAYLINHPGIAWEVLVTGHRDFGKGPTIRASKLLLGESVLTSEEPHHMRRRRLLQPLFRHEELLAHGATMIEHAGRTADRWSAEEVLDVREEMARLTLAIVASTIFATEVGSEDAKTVTRALGEILELFDRIYSPMFRLTVRLPVPSTRRFRRRRGELDRIVLRMIAERRSRAPGGDLLSLLLRALEDGRGMTDEQVRNEALTLFLAGHETTANALAWTFWLLSEHPNAEAKVHAELDGVLDGRRPSVRDLPHLPHTDAVISEALRLRPPAWAIGRTALVARELGGYPVREGSVVVVSPYLLHRDGRWFPEPHDFQAQRWLDGRAERVPRGAYLPFGAGPRQCLGEGFARMEARLVLATIAQRWRLRTVPGHPVELHPAVTLRPRHGIVMTLEPRGSSASSGRLR